MSGPTPNVTVTSNAQVVTSIVSDPLNIGTYIFTGGDLTLSPKVGYSMQLSNSGSYDDPLCTITSNPFTVYLPAQTDPSVGKGPQVTSCNATYYSQCSTTGGEWYLEFAFDLADFTKIEPYYRLGTSDVYIEQIGRDPDFSNVYQVGYRVFGMFGTIQLSNTSHISVHLEFTGNSQVYIFINGQNAAGKFYVTSDVNQHVVFSDIYNDYGRAAPLTTTPLTISNIILSIPNQTFTPSLQYLNTSSELFPFVHTTTDSNVLRFTTPAGQISTGSNAPTIVVDQTLSNDVQATATYTVTQVGSIPPISVITSPPVFPSTIRIKELVPFYYSFTTTNYYPPTSTTPTFLSTGTTPVTIVGTSNALISVPANFTDIIVTGDRIYPYDYLSYNNISLSIVLPFFTDAVDSASIGFDPLIFQITSGGTGTNTLVIEGYEVATYSSAQTLVYVPIPSPNPLIGSAFQIFLVDGSGHSNLVYGAIYIPSGSSVNPFSMHFHVSGGYNGDPTSVTVNAPAITQVTIGAPVPVSLDPFASGTSYLLPYSTGNGTGTLLVASEIGFTTLPIAIPIAFRAVALFNGAIVSSVESQLYVYQGVVISTPDIFDFPPPTYIYIPISTPYVFSVPKSPGTTLIFYNSDPIIRPYLSANPTLNTVTFSAPSGFTAPISNGLLSVQAVGPDGAISGTLNAYINASSNIITSVPPFTGSINLYKYEPFAYTYGFVPGITGLTLNAVASSAEVRTFVTPTTPGQSLSFSGTYNTSYANIVNLIVRANNGSNVSVSSLSNAVSVGAGRFSNPVNTVFSFYQYEDVSNTYGSNIPFDTAAPLDSPPGSTPVLPIGLSFASVSGSSNHFVLKGIPQFQTPSNQYLVLGVNSVTNQTVTTRITIVVNPPRIQITPPSTSVTGMQVGVPITPVTFTSIQPSALTINDFQYDWDILPDGLFFTDINGNPVSQPYHVYPTDPSLTIILKGTPTTNAAYAFVNSGSNLSNVKLYAFQYQPKGVQTNQTALMSFSFGETILFNAVNVPDLYATQPLTTSTLIIKAASYFPSGDPIVSITAPVLPDGLSLSNTVTHLPNYVNFVDYADGIYVSGTPTTVSTGVYPFTAISRDGYSQTLNLSIPILQDVVTFTSVTPASVVFIVSRPITLDYNLVFTAVSPIAHETIHYTTSFDITQYGLVFTVNNGSATITGTPTFPLSTTTLVVTATDTLGTFATASLQITINADQFTFNSPTLNFIQHVPITPVQFKATTTSQRSVISFTSTDLPSGLLLSTLGLLTGTPYNGVSGTFHITGSTGYPPGVSQPFSYTTVADNIVILLTGNPLAIPSSTFSVDAFRAFTYSGNTATVAVDQASIKDKNGGTTLIPTLAMSGTFLNGSFPTGAEDYSPFSFNVVGTYLNTTGTLAMLLYYNGTTGQLTATTSPGSLAFTSPTSLTYLFYQHCPIPPITFRISGATGFTYFYTIVANLPVGLTFTPDSSGTFATISGTPALYSDQLQSITVYALNNGYITYETIQIRVITPFFVNPQENGASAYTALLRNQVIVNGAQNARDNVVFPTTDASLGSLQSPGAPDVVSPPVPCVKGKN